MCLINFSQYVVIHFIYQQFISEEPAGFHLNLAQNQMSLLWNQSEVR